MRIKCPHCGERPLEEFNYLGDATPERPDGDASSMDAWFDYVYVRGNPKGWMREYWHHAGGCRSWLVAERHTESHEFRWTMTAREFAAKRRSA